MADVEQGPALPPKLAEIVAEFQEASPRERLEYLIDFAEQMPDLPAHLAGRRDEMEQVHECQTPVFLYVELEDGRTRLYFDVPRESPTVRGYAALVAEGLDGATPEEVMRVPDDLYRLLGLHEAISMLRLRGLQALMGYVKRQVLARSRS